ncbi:MAG: helix-turn-helix domain-containing protein [Anaerolineae bacterium]|nr:helix-turn-helix domain-containing protein [Anaerolineae bacterium]
MRSIAEYKEILSLWEQGENKVEIARRTGIPRTTVTDCVRRFRTLAGLEQAIADGTLHTSPTENQIIRALLDRPAADQRAYAYILGLYLGDGYLSRSDGHRVYRLRISLDERYPGIIQEAQHALMLLLPENRVGIVQSHGCVQVSSYSNDWPALLPQHGAGRKHTRPIALVPWQQAITDAHPLALLRGLYHSDGSRSQNIVKGRDYPRYLFANESPGIRALFCAACDRLGLHWTLANRRNVCVSRREDVAWLDHEIGPKT